MDGVKNMIKYDKMIAINREHSDEKIIRAKTAIQKMLDSGERISVPRLMEATGLSRGFFYKNPIVRKEIDDAVERQSGIIDPRRKILDQAMDKNIELLHQQIAKLQQENKRLKSENEKLHKALNKRNLNILKNL